MVPKMRESKYELLRIISIILILMSHSDEIFGLSDLYSSTIGFNKIITEFLHMGGQIGVGCFLLISGYFMVEKTITIKRLLKLTGQVWFYTIITWACWIIIKMFQGGVDLKHFVRETMFAFFPIILNHYWFITAFVILMILSPFLNKLIHSMDYRSYSRFLVIIIVIFVVLIGGVPNVLPEMVEGRLVPVVIIYFIAGYIKRFRTENRNNAGKHLAVAIIGYLALIASAYIITFVGLKTNNATILGFKYFYRVLNSPLVIIICVELFIFFTELRIKNSRIINTIASCSLGVYLIHKNRIIEPALSKLFPIYKETRPGYVFLYSVLAVCVMYIVFSLFDYFRQLTVEKIWLSFLDKHLEALEKRVIRIIKCVNKGIKKIGRTYYR